MPKDSIEHQNQAKVTNMCAWSNAQIFNVHTSAYQKKCRASPFLKCASGLSAYVASSHKFLSRLSVRHFFLQGSIFLKVH